jgi:hypothetical protein
VGQAGGRIGAALVRRGRTTVHALGRTLRFGRRLLVQLRPAVWPVLRALTAGGAIGAVVYHVHPLLAASIGGGSAFAATLALPFALPLHRALTAPTQPEAAPLD